MLDVNALTTGYNGKTVLHEVTLHVREGTVLALIGPNGSGKTTFIRAVSGVLPIREGSVKVRGEEIARMNPQQRARSIAVVPQARTIPPAFTAEEVVSLGRTPYLNWLGRLSDHDQNAIDEALRKTDLLELRSRNIQSLSGGELQRVLLARAMAQGSPLLLMDEPTTHLDLQYQVNLMERVSQLAHPTPADIAEGVLPRTVVISIHDLNLVSRYADVVGLLVGGRLAALGTPAEVLNGDLLSQAYRLPLKIIHENGIPLVVPDIPSSTG
jgi:iron complex transport system ATP-binding protein